MDNLTVQSVIFDKSIFNARKARKWLNNSGYKAPKMDETDEFLRFRQRAPSNIREDSYITKTLGNSGVKLILGKLKSIGGMMGDDDDDEDRKRQRILDANTGFRRIPSSTEQRDYYADRERIMEQLRRDYDAKLRGVISRIGLLSIRGDGTKSLVDLKSALSRIVEASQGAMGQGDIEDQSIEIDRLIEKINLRGSGLKRIPRKKGQPRKSRNHSDLYTDEDPVGTIHGLKFATPADAHRSIDIINESDATPNHRIQAAVAMEQRARVADKNEAADVYRKYIDSNKTSARTIGGKMKASAIADFIDASYSKKPPKELDGFFLDSKLSTEYAKVYYQPSTGEARVVHRGTEGLADWGNNLAYLAGAYNLTDRYKQGKKVQDAAEKKYGKKNISTLGHSQGAILARKLGSDTKEVINVNPAFKGEIPKKNEYNIRSDADVVSGLYAPVSKIRSILTPETSKKHDITIKSESRNPLSEHSADITRRLGEKEIGVGAGRRVAGRTSDIINWYLS